MTAAAAKLSGSPRSDVVLRYRRRAIGADELAFLRQVIAEHGARGRVHVSRVICEAWQWRQANGELSLAGCRDLLHRLADRGHLQLPPSLCGSKPKRPSYGKHPLVPRAWIPLAWHPLGDADIDLSTVEVRPIYPAEADGWRLFIERYHYLGSGRLVGEHLRYVAHSNGELLALLGWNAAALQVPARERFIGWDESRKREALHLVVNNVRFLVPPWIRKPHLASKVLALNLRRLSRDWVQAWGHPVYLAESFVDPGRFRGTSYRAANWQRIGRTAGRRRHGQAFLRDSSPKDIYVYPLVRHACERLCVEAA